MPPSQPSSRRGRFATVLALLLPLASCSPWRQAADGPAPAAPPDPPAPAARAAALLERNAQPAPARHAPAPPRFQQVRVADLTLRVVSFDTRSHRLEVADQAGGPGSEWAGAADAAAALGGVAAINGGFFTPAGEPLGLVVARGRRSGAWNRTSSLAGGCLVERRGHRPALLRRAAVDPRDPALVTLLQSGPFLVEHGRVVGGLESARVRPRSVVAWDGGHRWFVAVVSPCTMAGLAEALAASRPAGWAPRHVLNLDGGRSCELDVAASVSGGPHHHRPPFHNPVRNFLVLMPEGRDRPPDGP